MKKKAGMIAVIGGSALVAVGALGVTIGQDRTGYGEPLSAKMTTGVTLTQTVAPTAIGLPIAVPGITGPAPLPSEEQGLPG
jgi:hypothetical protein